MALRPSSAVLVVAGLCWTLGCREEKKEAAPSTAAAPASSVASVPAKIEGSGAEVAPAADESPFEGEAKLSVEGAEGEAGPRTFTVLLKGKKMRFEMPAEEAGPGVFAVLDLETQKMLSVVTAQKTAIEMDLGKFRESMKDFFPAAEEEPMNFRKTERTATIAGHTCVDWEGTSKEGDQHVVCLAKLGASWFTFPTDQFPVAPDFAKEMFDGAHVPLRVVHTERGKKPVRMEVVSLVRRALDDGLFAAPEGFRRVDLNAAMGALGGLTGAAADLSKQAQAGGGALTPEMRKSLEQLQKQAEAARKAAEATKK